VRESVCVRERERERKRERERVKERDRERDATRHVLSVQCVVRYSVCCVQ
jgi:hypothetical protein